MRRRMMKLVATCLIVAVARPESRQAPGARVSRSNDPSLTPRVAAEWKEATQRKDAQIQAAATSAPRTTAAAAVVSAAATSLFGLHTVSATNYKQETSYYCGPASARQSLSWHKAKSGSGDRPAEPEDARGQDRDDEQREPDLRHRACPQQLHLDVRQRVLRRIQSHRHEQPHEHLLHPHRIHDRRRRHRAGDPDRNVAHSPVQRACFPALHDGVRHR